MLSGTRRRSDFMTNGWRNLASDHGRAVPAGAFSSCGQKQADLQKAARIRESKEIPGCNGAVPVSLYASLSYIQFIIVSKVSGVNPMWPTS